MPAKMGENGGANGEDNGLVGMLHLGNYSRIGNYYSCIS